MSGLQSLLSLNQYHDNHEYEGTIYDCLGMIGTKARCFFSGFGLSQNGTQWHNSATNLSYWDLNILAYCCGPGEMRSDGSRVSVVVLVG